MESTAIDALFTSITGEAPPKHLAFLMAKDEKNGSLSGPGMELLSKAVSKRKMLAVPV
tara:strand:+ start:1760 stop:1933 length:174 start_codon:yes stop_codon:yes gene_type:complete